MSIGRALANGAAGALTVTALNEGVRRVYPHAPRMDVIGMRALAAMLRGAHVEPPARDDLYYVTLVGDLATNTLYYSLVGDAPTWKRGIGLGLAAGIGAALLPQPLGLGTQPRQRVPITQLLTVAWYVAGGIAAVVAARRR
jgi:hypothetical protein